MLRSVRNYSLSCKICALMVQVEHFRFPSLNSASRNFICSTGTKQSQKSDRLSKDEPHLKPFIGDDENTWVGPPHPVSNLRLKIFPKSQKLTEDEKYFYKKSLEIQVWNQTYWENHNKDFEQSKKSYIEKVSKEKNLSNNEALTAEEMSHFYREFLDKNHKKHISYNWEWYRKNFSLLLLAAKANFSKLRRAIKSKLQ